MTHLAVELVGILLGDDLLHGGRHEDVALLKHQILPLVGRGAGEALDGAVVRLVLLQLLRVHALGVEDAAVVLEDADALRPGPVEVAHRMEAHIAEALDDDALARPAGRAADHRHVTGLIDEVVDAVEEALVEKG